MQNFMQPNPFAPQRPMGAFPPMPGPMPPQFNPGMGPSPMMPPGAPQPGSQGMGSMSAQDLMRLMAQRQPGQPGEMEPSTGMMGGLLPMLMQGGGMQGGILGILAGLANK